jgi:hypothetical protein
MWFWLAMTAAAVAAEWHSRAIVYGVTPYIFTEGGKLEAVTEKLPELADLGVTVIWLQPVFANHGGGQGYDIVDYFRMRDDVGSEDDLRQLVRTAHGLGLKVILDFPANHTSLHHPFAQDAIAHGAESPYSEWYQREPDGVRYARHYHRSRAGKMDFIHYFWEDLPNLNLAHPGVRKMLIEAGRHWIERFDVDGYRLDAAWGLNHRTPDFLPEFARELKALKPDLWLLGEDKAGDPLATALRRGLRLDHGRRVGVAVVVAGLLCGRPQHPAHDLQPHAGSQARRGPPARAVRQPKSVRRARVPVSGEQRHTAVPGHARDRAHPHGGGAAVRPGRHPLDLQRAGNRR